MSRICTPNMIFIQAANALGVPSAKQSLVLQRFSNESSLTDTVFFKSTTQCYSNASAQIIYYILFKYLYPLS